MRNKIVITQEQVEYAYELASKGECKTEIAKNIGLSYSIFCTYLGFFTDAIKNGRAVYQEETAHKIERALVKRALGYDFTETKTEMEGDKVTKNTNHEKQMAGNVPAQEFYLINYSRKYKNDNWQSINTVTLAEDSEKIDLLNQLAQHLKNNIEEPKKVSKTGKK